MSEQTYNFNTIDFPNSKYDMSKLTTEIGMSNITIALSHMNGTDDDLDIIFKALLTGEDTTTLSGVVAAHDGIDATVEDTQFVTIKSSEINLGVDIADELRDRSGKLRMHQTSRKMGTVICWTGEGDDTTDPSCVGGGEPFSFNYITGQPDPLIKYIDFNMVENETWLHEGYVTWSNCFLDTLDLMMVTRATPFTVASGTSYTLYGGYLIVPTYPGTGTIDLASDITEHDGGLVYTPKNDVGVRPTAFWDATWDPSTSKFIDIAPNPYGQGEYNLFAAEIPIAHFVRKMPLLNSGFIALNSSDTDQLGSGMRLKMVADTNTTISGLGDHDWSIACTMCLHRARTV